MSRDITQAEREGFGPSRGSTPQTVRGQDGNDYLASRDAVQGSDSLFGGQGEDFCVTDNMDATVSCPSVSQSPEKP